MRGDTAQRKFGTMLQRMGLCVLPAYAFEDVVAETKAPVMLAPHVGTLITPDLFAMADNYTRWFEVKDKSVPTWYRKLSRWEHGCDKDIFDEYCIVQEKSGVGIRIVVHEVSSPENDTCESKLVSTGGWLWIPLSEARRLGDWRSDWPGGKSQPNRRGRNRRGGWLWPRLAMKPIPNRREE